MLKYLTIEKFSEASGYTPEAVRTKIKRGVWAPGREYTRAPDGRVLVDIEGYTAWVESTRASMPRVRRAS